MNKNKYIASLLSQVANTIEVLLANDGWILCSEKYPENEKEVEITFIRKHWKTGESLYCTARAFYENGTTTTGDSDFCWEEGADWEYVEGKMDM